MSRVVGFIFFRGRGINVLFVCVFFESFDDFDMMNFCVYLREIGLVLIYGIGLYLLFELVRRFMVRSNRSFRWFVV